MTTDSSHAGRRAAFGALALACFAWLTCSPAGAQERKPIAGTSVSLAVPKGFEPASGFAGLVNKANQASVLIAELPAEAYPQLVTLFDNPDTARAGFARQGIAIARLDQIDVNGDKVPLLSGTQTLAAGVHFDKWMALFKGEKTVMLTVQAPQAAKLGAAEVRALVASVSLGKVPTLAEKVAALPFSITPAAPFRTVDTIGGAGLLITAGDKDVDPSGTQPLMIVAYQTSAPAKAGQEEALAEALLKGTRDLGSAEIKERRRLRFAGQNGVLLKGAFKHPNGSSKSFAQYLAIGPEGRFLRLLVTADPGALQQLQPAIDQTVASVAFTAK